MVEQDRPLGRYVTEFRALAEGRTAPEDWLAWWAQHGQQIKELSSPGVFLRLKPRHGDEFGGIRAAVTSQEGACRVLEALGVACDRSDRYQMAWRQVIDRLREEQAAEAARKAEGFGPVIASLAVRFPRFAAFLAAGLSEVDSCGPGLDDVAVDQLEHSLGLRLPAAYRVFLQCAREVIVGDTLQMTSSHPFVHDSRSVALPSLGMLCIADYWLEADGDQVLFDVREDSQDDPPVLYYAHGQRQVRVIADSFTAWLEGLPKTLAS
ncbi:SMI1/KNR4 family protein (plasmid) [Streptomyces sp. NBC_01591]|uniref:SMI1/KNR4 family protein n=1 Tax=Streptomyces sp. NBC_01591 TaxID=2975888 RepID=UPI002DDC4AF4|nr:SMI1/KNR4 family protein [Streptomyces sp. NBC_01591]WSD73812.1 SMI1/KNR4 family protein [Streptomyces sp. NBC_01591]